MIGKQLRHLASRIRRCILKPRFQLDPAAEVALERLLEYGIPNALNFDFPRLKHSTLAYVNSLRVSGDVFAYRYSHASRLPTLYASAYACMTQSLYGSLNLGDSEAHGWIDYFDSHQSSDDGLFRDPVLAGEMFEKEDWWGARHLAIHIIIAYTALRGRPKHDFRFLQPLYESGGVRRWLESRDWKNRPDFVSNEIMNRGVLLQYSRDRFKNRHAETAIREMLDWLDQQVDSSTGMWEPGNLDTPAALSRAVQTAYHILALFTYDNRVLRHAPRLVDHVLLTQNRLGGFGVRLNSTGCEDIDSIEPLVRLGNLSDYRRSDIRNALWRALPWVLSNQNADGGFVFARGAGFRYGHAEMETASDQSSLFGTWWRTLSLAYLSEALFPGHTFVINRTPGLEFSTK